MEILDTQKIISNLKYYIDDNIDINKYNINISFSNDEKVMKYIITVEDSITEQYSKFVLPCNITDEYTLERFETDMYRKIANCIRENYESSKYNSTVFSTLKIGESFILGRFDGKPIEWKILYKKENELYVISKDTLCERKFDDFSSEWCESDLRQWLNNDFYNSVFTKSEKQLITQNVVGRAISYNKTNDKVVCFIQEFDEEDGYIPSDDDDHIRILDHSEGRAFELFNKELLPNGTEWVYAGAWNVGQLSINGHKCGYLCTQDGDRLNNGRPAHLPNEFFGIRPVLWIKY